MANENKNEEKILESTMYLWKNRMGLQPNGMTFSLTNRDVESALVEFFKSNGIPDDGNYQIRVFGNKKFNTKNGNNGEEPFIVRIVTTTKRSNTDQNPDGSAMYKRILRNTLDTEGRKQIELLGRDKLNACVAKFSKKGEVTWVPATRNNKHNKGVYVMAFLDFEKVMGYVWEKDAAGNRPVVFDFLTYKALGKINGRDRKGRPTNLTPGFQASLLVQFQREKFKQHNADPMDFIY